eukprot:TRINITY_DN40256_c0_g1_i1.p2 TRINITY_DN40256_c0_g1~~TRINITY_DN40256_c0_g1_i1.p2  ORF type:complete len:219 (-),score=62.11 TRINITY_DN40256_c0_g1_i1:90-722(-)
MAALHHNPVTGEKEKKQLDSIMLRVKEAVKRRGVNGIRDLSRTFKIFDDDNSKSLDKKEFGKGLKDYGLTLAETDLALLLRHFDRDGDGTISYDEFIRGIRGELNATRRAIVRKAFDKLDKDGSGIVELNDVKGVYNGSKHPKVLSGEKTEDEILLEFLDNFDTIEKDGKVTFEEFCEYYAGVSCSIDDDPYFTAMMYQAWRLQRPTVFP